MMTVMDWVTVLGMLMSGGIAGGVAFGLMRGRAEMTRDAMRREMDLLRNDVKALQERIDRVHNGKG